MLKPKLRHLLLTAFALLLALVTLPVGAQSVGTQSAAGKPHHVLFALTSGDQADWNLTLGNIRNLLTGLAPDQIEVEVVAYGPGLTILIKPSAVDADIQALIAKHVVFVACENSMRMRKVTKADLIDNVGSVPSGIVEVVKKQEAGWTYIKAGR